MLIAKNRMEDELIGFDTGTHNYLVKPFGIAELLARLRGLQRSSPPTQTRKIQLENFTLDYETPNLYDQDIEITLTNKEFQLLEYFLNILIKLLPVTKVSINFGN
jgi:DNA-binding response OmpR family regulator